MRIRIRHTTSQAGRAAAAEETGQTSPTITEVEDGLGPDAAPPALAAPAPEDIERVIQEVKDFLPTSLL